MSSSYLTMCISCKEQVRPRQEGLQCDGCLRWQHRICHTGVWQADYRNAVKTGASIDWRCLTCDFPQAESSFQSCQQISLSPKSSILQQTRLTSLRSLRPLIPVQNPQSAQRDQQCTNHPSSRRLTNPLSRDQHLKQLRK